MPSYTENALLVSRLQFQALHSCNLQRTIGARQCHHGHVFRSAAAFLRLVRFCPREVYANDHKPSSRSQVPGKVDVLGELSTWQECERRKGGEVPVLWTGGRRGFNQQQL